MKRSNTRGAAPQEDMGSRHATQIVTDIRIVCVFVLSYALYFHIIEVKYG